MAFYAHPPAWREHVCGLYYNIIIHGRLQKTFLPQVDLQAHATILATTSRTKLTQTFVNPSTEKGIREVRYTFPLYDGVSVVGFKCQVGDRTIVGEVKEKEKARAVFKDAVARGETAGLFEQLPEASDVFTTTVGNIPPGSKVVVEIIYLGELKHDMEVDGIRFTIPNVICPRYGTYPGDFRSTPATEAMGGGISITVDAEMADGSFIQKMQSPTHPISMTMGTLSTAPNDDPIMTRASATLTLGTAQLDTDFVLQVIAKNTGVPKAVLENHSTIPNHRALMATLVPKFALPPEKPEIVFVCDRSGSMSGSNITLVIQALKVFLKSLPVGVKFNICSFGSSYSFLWKKSVTYSQTTLDEAIRHAETFSANFGGTEMLKPLKATIEQRYKDMPLDVMLLTDGEIWNQQDLFTYLNKAVGESKAPIRLFTLGIGNGVSHALIEGVARAGDGFSQTVGQGEKMDTKVVRMLKGALSPHIKDYTLEVKYSKDETMSDTDDDFVVVEKVADSLKVQLDLKEKQPSIKKKIISLFDSSADPDKEEPPAYDETGESKYAHLPHIAAPKIIQAPHNIPSLFAFNRTTAYLLMGPEAPSSTPKSVVLRGTSTHGPLELEIPIQILDHPGETIHQLAAKKAIHELEQGRGWLTEAKDQSGKFVKNQFEGRFEDMVEREAVRLGVQFQVGGKWCSFVAVESNQKNAEGKEDTKKDWDWLEDESPKTTTNCESADCLFGPVTKAALEKDEIQQVQGPAPGSRKYEFVSDSSEDDEDFDEEALDTNLDALHGAAKRLNLLSTQMKEEAERQDRILDRMTDKSDVISNSETDGNLESQRGFPRKMSRSRRTAEFSAAPPAPAAQARLSSLQADVDSTVSIMHGNISRISERGEKLDLVEQSEMLSHQASAFGGSDAIKKRKPVVPFGSMFGGSSMAPESSPTMSASASASKSSGGLFGGRGGFGSSLFGGGSGRGGFFGSSSPRPPVPAPSGSLFGAAPSSTASFGAARSNTSPSSPPGAAAPSLFGSAQSSVPLPPQSFGAPAPGSFAFGQSPTLSQPSASAFGAPPPAPAGEGKSLQDYQMGLMLLEQQNKKRLLFARQEQDNHQELKRRSSGGAAAAPAPSNQSPEELTHYLIGLQTFEGFWEPSPALLSSLQISEEAVAGEVAKLSVDKKFFVTALIIAAFEKRLKDFEGSWELVVEKAKNWLEGEYMGEVDDLIVKAGALIK